ncbi:hypothetical protein BDD43_3974 [Mucilaginibacter gracilis]|uniref:TIGR04255 family protein n=1 Tax=Mucilaginibacter gracilis TaxID=423350 RepID=A0A495J454_9SPHI|nr:hypothetical protein [Mucilaginibacter gracilis]RKR83760.1 hypothetical protein BDD43_3974 [Mucilaginibacter gracilis]
MPDKFLPVKFTASIYTNNQEITPEPNLMRALYQDLAKFEVIPGAYNELDTKTSNIVTNRLRFYKLDNSLTINFGINRIDIQANYNATGVFNSIQAFCDQVIDILEIINKKYEKKSNRLGIVINLTSQNLDAKALTNDFKPFYHTTELFENSVPTDWNNRANYRYIRDFGSKKELCNNVYIFSYGAAEISINGIIVRQNAVNLQLDINTIPEAQNIRFSAVDYTNFYNNSSKWLNDFYQSLESRFNKS